jgi:hypothetical protein
MPEHERMALQELLDSRAADRGILGGKPRLHRGMSWRWRCRVGKLLVGFGNESVNGCAAWDLPVMPLLDARVPLRRRSWPCASLGPRSVRGDGYYRQWVEEIDRKLPKKVTMLASRKQRRYAVADPQSVCPRGEACY